MRTKNKEIAEIFRQIAEILEIQDENPFRIRAYLKAAQNVESLSRDIAEIVQQYKDLFGVIAKWIGANPFSIL